MRQKKRSVGSVEEQARTRIIESRIDAIEKKINALIIHFPNVTDGTTDYKKDYEYLENKIVFLAGVSGKHYDEIKDIKTSLYKLMGDLGVVKGSQLHNVKQAILDEKLQIKYKLSLMIDRLFGIDERVNIRNIPEPKIKLVDELDMGVRSINALKNNDINTIEQLWCHTKEDLLRLKGIGNKTAEAIELALKENGLTLHKRLGVPRDCGHPGDDGAAGNG